MELAPDWGIILLIVNGDRRMLAGRVKILQPGPSIFHHGGYYSERDYCFGSLDYRAAEGRR